MEINIFKANRIRSNEYELIKSKRINHENFIRGKDPGYSSGDVSRQCNFKEFRGSNLLRAKAVQSAEKRTRQRPACNSMKFGRMKS